MSAITTSVTTHWMRAGVGAGGERRPQASARPRRSGPQVVQRQVVSAGDQVFTHMNAKRHERRPRVARAPWFTIHDVAIASAMAAKQLVRHAEQRPHGGHRARPQ